MIKHMQIASIGVSDQQQARDFYVTKVGFKLHNEMELPDGLRWVEVIPADGQTSISLEPTADPTWLGRHTGFIFASDDIEADYKAMTERGVKFVTPPTFQGWGTYCEFEDLDGNRSGLAQMGNGGQS